MHSVKIGIMGGSGLYDMDALCDVREHVLDTPYGRPSDAIITGTVHGVAVAFLPRHGRGHRLLPAEVPYRANIFALRQLGVRYLLSLSAVGSLRENIAPLDMVLPDQFIDLTRQRDMTFFGDGIVAHVSMALPVCAALRQLLAQAVTEVGADDPIILHQDGCYVCIDGPQFSTLAESNWYRSLGASVIGMTNMPEAKLAREAQMAYASLAMVTDYDCWHPREAHVTADSAIANLRHNTARAQRIVVATIALVAGQMPLSLAHNSLANALVTAPETMSPGAKALLDVLMAH